MTLKIALSASSMQLAGQTYDGASNMLGYRNGVAKQMQDEQPKALVTHCHGHSLSLSIKDLTSQCKLLNDTMGTVGEITILVKYSPKPCKVLAKARNISWHNKGKYRDF